MLDQLEKVVYSSCVSHSSASGYNFVSKLHFEILLIPVWNYSESSG